MGYTHYWYREEKINEKVFENILTDFKDVLPEFDNILDTFTDQKLELNSELAYFNGIGDNSHETFYFPLDTKAIKYIQKDDELVFQFCKTARKEYDIAVTCFLIIAKYFLKDKIRIQSDGNTNDWQQARIICQNVLGYGSDFQLDQEN